MWSPHYIQVEPLCKLPVILQELQGFTVQHGLLAIQCRELRDEASQLNSECKRMQRELTELESEKASAEQRAKGAKLDLRECIQKAKQTPLTEALSAEINRVLQKVEEPHDIDNIETYLAEIKQRMDVLYQHDPTLIRQFEQRKRDIEQAEQELEVNHEELERRKKRLAEDKEKWLNGVRPIVTKMNRSFSEHMQAMGHRGAVELKEDEDYSKWAIDLLVAYRNQPELKSLDSNAQSGGEKSLATVMYLSAMQDITPCPFRIVDEINQGMDEANERTVFEMVTKNACTKEEAPQTFMLSQKVVTGLKYPRGITVLIIYNGPYNISQNEMDQLCA